MSPGDEQPGLAGMTGGDDARRERLGGGVSPVSEAARGQAQARFAALAKPPHSLGRLEAVVMDLAAIQHNAQPSAARAVLWLFAADHGLVDEGVSAWPQAVTGGMLGCFARGGAAINQICRVNDIAFQAVDAGVAQPPAESGAYRDLSMGPGTASSLRGPAMSPAQALDAMERGHELLSQAPAAELVAFGEMGIGNTAAASLVTHALTGADLRACVGRGAGQDESGLTRKREILERVAARHGQPADPLTVMACYGGFEMAMMAGAALAAARRGQAVLVDGFIATAAIALACRLVPALRPYCIFCHRSAEPGHALLLASLAATPLLSMDMALGEGSGAAMAVPLIRAALACYRDMETVEAVLATLPELSPAP